MRAVLTAATLKGDADGIHLPNVGTAPGRVSLRTFRDCMTVPGKLKMSQDLAWLSATKAGSYQFDVLISSLFSQFFTGIGSVSNQCRSLFSTFRAFKTLPEIVHIAARIDIVLIIRNKGSVLINGLRESRKPAYDHTSSVCQLLFRSPVKRPFL